MKLQILVNETDLEVATDIDVIKSAGEKLLEKGLIQQEYITACVEREQNFPTGLLMCNGQGIAIPHANYQLVKQNSISIIRPKSPVEFKQMEDPDLKVNCQLVFNLALASSDQHLSVLRKLFTLLQKDDFVNYCFEYDIKQVKNYVHEKLI